jgi:uncharacterized repeat protein (TIGR01451 family)
MSHSTVRPSWQGVIGLLLFVCFILPASAQVQITMSDVHHDVSGPLRELAGIAPAKVARAKEAEPIRSIPVPPGLKPAGVPDSVLQQSTLAAPGLVGPTPGLNFEGMGRGLAGFGIVGAPPDTNGAVGLTQYVQWVNTSFAIFNKSTGAMVLGPVAGNSLWHGFGGNCEVNNDGDPIVLYDKLADRWIFSQFSVENSTGGVGPFLQCVAVSTTSDATGSYNRYAFEYTSFDDYPKMGVWPDAYYVTFNMFAPPSFGFAGAEACAYDRNAMLAGDAATQVCFQQGTSVGGLLPSDVDGHTPPPIGSPNYMAFFGANTLNLFKFHVDFATPANSTFTGPTIIPVAPFTPLCNGGTCVTQPGTITLLDSLADRLMYRLAYRNFGNHESLVVNHSVAVGGTATSGGGVRWYEIRNPNGTPALTQQSTFAPDTAAFRWMGSLAMDQAGNMVLGYSVSSGSTFPSAAFTARSVSDPPGTMGPETTIIRGTGSQTTDSFGRSLTRWGDYSAMQVDPSDDCTFWYTSEYMATTGIFNWNTRIATFKFPGCEKQDLTISSAHTGNFTQGQNGATYTLTVSNIGSLDTSETVTVVDSLPSGLAATTITGTGWSCDLPTLTCTRNDVLTPNNSYPPITLTVNVADNAAGRLFNSATVAGGGESNAENDGASDLTTIIQLGPDPTVATTHAGTFTQGQTGTYNISVTNVGLSPLDSSPVTATDTLPAGLTANTVSGAGWSCVVGPPVKCTRTDALASNASYPAITLTVNVAKNAPSSVVNTVSVSGGGETNTLNDSASDPTTVVPPPSDLTITKTHTGDFKQGQSFAVYAITVTNSGSSATNGVVTLTDTLPTGLSFAGMFGPGWNCNILTCTRNDALAVGSSYPVITLSVNVAGNAPASVTNTAVVSGGGEVNVDNDTASDLTTITPAPDLTITKSHVGDFTAGQPGAYTVTVSNGGAAATTGQVNVTDFLPFGMTATTISATGWICSQVPTSFVSCQRSDVLNPAISYPAINITVRVDGASSAIVTNVASVSGGGELNLANDSASDPTNVSAPVIAITKSHSPATFIVGQTGTYTITVSNTGAASTSTSLPVNISDFLPQGMTATSITAPGWTCSSAPTTFVNCTRSDTLAPGDTFPSITLTIRVDGSSSSTVTNSALASGGGDLNNHIASDPTPVTAPVLAITKSHTGSFTLGQPGSYTISVSNSGTIATQPASVVVNDFLPFGMTATSISGSGWTCPPTPTSFVNCTRSDVLAPGNSYPSITITVSLDSSVGPSPTNLASVSGGGDLSTHNAFDPTTINLPDLAVAKTHVGDFFIGQTGAVYTITVSNVGKVSTVGGSINLNDFLPQGLFATAAGGAGWNCTSGQFVSCNRLAGTLAPGSSYPAVLVTVNVAADAPATIVNSVGIGGIGDANFNNNSASDSTKILRVAVRPNSSPNVTVTAGNPATFAFLANLATSPSVGTVTFTATGLPANSTATFSPPTVTQSGAIALTINTSGNGHVASLSPFAFPKPASPYIALLFLLAGLVISTLSLYKRKKSWLRWTICASCFCLVVAFSGCGGGGGVGGSGNPPPVPTPTPVTQAGTYTITVTGNSSVPGVQPATTQVVLVVQ